MGTWLASVHFKAIQGYIVSFWAAVFVLFYFSAVVVGIVQSVRRKDVCDTVTFPVLGIVWGILFMPIALAFRIVGEVFAYVLSIPFYLIAGGFWLLHKIRRKPKKQTGL